MTSALKSNPVYIPRRWYSDQTVRPELIRQVGDPVLADGIAVTAWRCMNDAFLDGVKLDWETLMNAMPNQLYTDAAVQAGFLRDVGDYVQVYLGRAIIESHAHPEALEIKEVELQAAWDAIVEATPSADPLDIPGELEALYVRYPKRKGQSMGKGQGMKRLLKQIKTREDLDRLAVAVESMRAARESGLIREDQFVPMWSSFASTWLDWLPENSGAADQPVKPF